ncbi:amphoterin-induced protein 2 [Lepus europaeus]|uniref:amphoterin-induced protein 2 n=1 Tax=Lepus europaeus TaxID=9983 RepID=UPI002B48ED44|nr:amphoterin-induced protein 2 [Lepus europaeus]
MQMRKKYLKDRSCDRHIPCPMAVAGPGSRSGFARAWTRRYLGLAVPGRSGKDQSVAERDVVPAPPLEAAALGAREGRAEEPGLVGIPQPPPCASVSGSRAAVYGRIRVSAFAGGRRTEQELPGGGLERLGGSGLGTHGPGGVKAPGDPRAGTRGESSQSDRGAWRSGVAATVGCLSPRSVACSPGPPWRPSRPSARRSRGATMSARPRCRGLLCLLAVTAAVRPGACGLCPAACTCATDVVSCTDRNLSRVPANLFRLVRRLDLSYNRIGLLDSDWMPSPLLKLSTLVVRHNHVASVSAGSFAATPNVRSLDLSCNRLQSVRDAAFQELRALEVLLLYDNRISRLDPAAFGGLSRLQRLYLSGNSLTQFPVGLYLGRFRLAALTFLDVSYNRIPAVPVHHMHLVPGRQLRGIHLHGNPFVCDCALHSLLAFWYRRRFSAVVEFRDHYTCRPAAAAGSGQQVPLLRESFLNCSDSVVNGSFHALGFVREAQVGERLVVHCDSKAGTANTDFLWLGPDNRLLEPDKDGENFHVFPNGSLVIESPRPEDAGVYSCIAMNRQHRLNETLDVTITVSNFSAVSRAHAHEAFNTAFTTLAACVASIVLVLLYLYLTPCPCRCKARRQRSMPSQSSGGGPLSVPSPGPAAEGAVDEPRAGAGKRVVFLEPLRDAAARQNGRVRLFPGEAALAEGILKSSRGKSDSGSVNSVFSDTPFVAST